MSAFTRGPWKRSELFTGGIYVTSKDGVIADVRPVEGGAGEANALVIAAAPELVDALRDLLSTLQSDDVPLHVQDWFMSHRRVIAARAVLTKACPQ